MNNEKIAQQYKTDRFTITLYYDPHPTNPRERETNLSHIICWDMHREVGDHHTYYDTDAMFNDLLNKYVPIKVVKEFLLSGKGDAWLEYRDFRWILHDGNDLEWATEYGSDDEAAYQVYITRSVLSMADYIELLDPYVVFDRVSYLDTDVFRTYIGRPSGALNSGHIGFIFQTKADTLRYMPKANEDNWKGLARSNMDAEMDAYMSYQEGGVYGIVLTDNESGDVLSESWGYYGDPELHIALTQLKRTYNMTKWDIV